MFIIALLGNLIAFHLCQSGQYAQSERDDQQKRFFRDILDGRLNSGDKIQFRQEKLGIRLSACLRTVVAVHKKEFDAPRVSFVELTERMAELLPQCYAFLYQNSINLVLSYEDPKLDMMEYLRPLNQLLAQHHMIAGISNPFSSITLLRENSFQAMKALELGTGLCRNATLHFYRDYSIYHMIETSMSSGGTAHFCMPELGGLLDYCEKNGTELLDTLETYLRCKCNKVQTAKAMYTHHNTIKYRINRIEEMMGINLSDPDTIVFLTLSLKVLEYNRCFLPGKSEFISK